MKSREEKKETATFTTEEQDMWNNKKFPLPAIKQAIVEEFEENWRETISAMFIERFVNAVEKRLKAENN